MLTLFQVAMVFNSMAAIVMLGTFLTRKTYPGFGWWTFGVALQAAGPLIVPPETEKLLLIHLGGLSLVILGYTFLLRGLAVFRGIRWPFWIDGTLLVSFVALFGGLLFEEKSSDLRIGVLSLYVGLVGFLISYLSFSKRHHKLIPTDYVFGCWSFLFAIAGLFRAYLHLNLETHTLDFFSNTAVTSYFALFTILTLQLSTLSFLSLNSNRIEQDYRNSEEKLREERLRTRESEDRLNLVLDGVDSFIFIKGKDLRYQYFNKKAAQLFGKSPEELVGKTDFDLFPQEYAEAYRLQDRGILATGERFDEDDILVVSEPERQMTLHSIKIPLRTPSGEIYGICGIAYDITERKKLENELEHHRKNLESLIAKRTLDLDTKTELLRLSEERYAYAIEATSDGIWDWKISEGKLYVNPAYAKMLGYSHSEISEDSSQWSSLLHPDDQIWVLRDAAQHLISPGHYEFEFRMRCKDGSYKWILSRGKAVSRDPQGRPLRAVGTHVDLTPRKQLEIQLRQAKEVAESSTQIKSFFLANISHEIRTPMNGIIGMARLALQSTKDEKNQSYLQKILSSSQHLLTLLNDILDFSKMEAGKMELEDVTFESSRLAHDLEEMVIEKAREKKISFEIQFDPEIPSHLIGDPLRVLQVLLNYADNAIKFTEKGFVQVRGEKVEDSKNDVLLKFSVVDSGIGINPEKAKGLFQIFQQADASTTRRYGGTGLGLVIAKRLTEMMGGEVGFKAEEERGSEFWFTVRLKKANSHPTQNYIGTKSEVRAETSHSPSLKERKILLVEDNSLNQEVTCAYLEELGVQISKAFHGAEAIQLLEKEDFDLILMDLQMPVMDGLKATEIIRSVEKWKNVPIIAVTASAMAGDREKCLSIGMNDYLAKPLDPDELRLKVLRHLDIENSSAQQETHANCAGAIDELQLIDGLQPEEGLKYCLGQKELYLDLLKQFCFQEKDTAKILFSAVSLKESKKCRDLLQSLQTNATVIGAYRIRRLAEQIQKQLDQESAWEDLDAFFDQLEWLDQALSQLNLETQSFMRLRLLKKTESSPVVSTQGPTPR